MPNGNFTNDFKVFGTYETYEECVADKKLIERNNGIKKGKAVFKNPKTGALRFITFKCRFAYLGDERGS